MSTGKQSARNSVLTRFGRGITILRSRRQLTRKGLANRLKVSYAQLGFWERGICGPPLPKLFALTRILDTSLDELIEVGGEERPRGPASANTADTADAGYEIDPSGGRASQPALSEA